MDEISGGRGKSVLRRTSTKPTAPACPMCGHPTHMFDKGVQFRCRNCDDEWTIHITDHAWERWDERSETPDKHPIEAYKYAIRFLDEGTRVKGDEFRYDHASRCLFIRKRQKVVTIEHVPSCRPPIQRATIRSILRADRDGVSPITDLCGECNVSVDKLKEIVRFERGIGDTDVLIDESEGDDTGNTTLRNSGPAFEQRDTGGDNDVAN